MIDFDNNHDINEQGAELAVCAQNVRVQYSNKVIVLNKVSLRIPKGKIYALLGPNGVGKTTLIRAILGSIKLTSGLITVFNKRPGVKGSDIPGVGLGYMPQELALINEFTINDILMYYSFIYHMSSEDVKDRIEVLMGLLDLPEKCRLIGSLSGGQQRLVSIAVTLIHRPKLIVLDEPTVGVDSLLRHRIWSYLEYICSTNGQTVIITTHYIEEAKSAANVAFMSGGTVLRQSNPQKLLHEYNCQTLEEVFLILCQQNGEEISEEMTEINDSKLYQNFDEKIDSKNIYTFSLFRIKAILWRYYLMLYRAPLFLVAFLSFPFILVIFMEYSISHHPDHIPIAIHNGESDRRYSQFFISALNTKTLTVNEYTDNKTAFESVVNGYNYMSVVFAKNFSQSLDYRLTDIDSLTDQELADSNIKISVDNTNLPVTTITMIEILKALYEMLGKISIESNDHSIHAFQSPLAIKESFYGSIDSRVTSQLPAFLMNNIEFLFVIVFSFALIINKSSSCWERTFMAGVTRIEYYLAQVAYGVCLTLLHTIFTMIILHIFISDTHVDSYIDVFLLIAIHCLNGMSLGILLALLFNDMVYVLTLILVSSLCATFISGSIWPIEAIPLYIRWVTDYHLVTKPSIALQAVMYKGWNYTNGVVLEGYITNALYLLIFNIINIILIHKY